MSMGGKFQSNCLALREQDRRNPTQHQDGQPVFASKPRQIRDVDLSCSTAGVLDWSIPIDRRYRHSGHAVIFRGRVRTQSSILS